MLRDRENDGKEKERLIHAPEENFDDSQEPSVFGTFYRTNGEEPAPQERLYSNMNEPEEAENSDDEIKRPLFLSFKANDPASDVSEALREQNNADDLDISMPIEDTEPLEDPTLSDEQIFDPLAQDSQFFEEFPEDEQFTSSQPATPAAPSRPSIMDTMYAKEDYLSSIPKYEVDNSLEDEINASLGSESFSPFQPFAAFRPANEPVEVAKPEPVAEPEPVVEPEPVAEPETVVSQEPAPEAVPETIEETVTAEAQPEEQPAVSEPAIVEEQSAVNEPTDTSSDAAQETVIENADETTVVKEAETASETSVEPETPVEQTTEEKAEDNTEEKGFFENDIDALAPSPLISVASMGDNGNDSSATSSETTDESTVSESEQVEDSSSDTETATEAEATTVVTEESAPVSSETVAETAEAAAEKADETAVDTSSLYDTAPIEEPALDDGSEGYEAIYRENEQAVEETPSYSAPQVHPNVSIASTNLVPIDRVYNQPKRPAKVAEDNSGKVTQNHLLFGDEDEATFHKAANERIEQNKKAKEAAEAAAAVAAANATEVTITPTNGLRPGSSLSNKSEDRTVAEEPKEEPAKPAGTQRPGAAMSRPGAVKNLSTSAQVAATQRHTYTAASQRGSITPVEQQDHAVERKRSIAKPLIFICLGLLCLGGLVFCWFHFDLGKSLFSNDDEKKPATTISEQETDSTKGTKVIEISSDNSSETTTEEPTTTTTEEPTTTTTEEPTTTTTEEPTTTTTEEPTTTTTEEPTTTTTTEATTTEATTTSQEPSETTVAPSDYPVTSFSYKITNAKVSGNNCSFDLKLSNSGSKTSSLNASIESITIKFNTSVKITNVNCTNFTAVPKEGSKNTFYLYPNSNDAVAKKESIVASIEGEGESHISTFTITGVYIKYNK